MVTVKKGLDGDRVKSAIGVAAFHALLGYALLTGLGFRVPDEVAQKLKLFDVAEEPPPPPQQSVPSEVRVEAPEGAASPPSRAANPTPVVAPPPVIRLNVPPPMATVPLATPVPQGVDPTAGAATVEGPGTGTGGEGVGTGAGGAGDGTGGGGRTPARWLRGRITPADYPPAAVRALASGTVYLRFVVGTDGRVNDCAVTRSSGNAALDSTTCRLIIRRFRYRPALDARGRPIPEAIVGDHDWAIERAPDREIEPVEEEWL